VPSRITSASPATDEELSFAHVGTMNNRRPARLLHRLAAMTHWPNLASIAACGVLIAACASTHEGPPDADAGPERDGSVADSRPPPPPPPPVDSGGPDAVPPPMCRPSGVTEVRVREVVTELELVTVTAIERGGGSCGCTPELVWDGALGHSLELCGCCDACDCIDPGYEASTIFYGPAEGDYTITVAGTERALAVRPLSRCGATPPTPTAIRIVPPDPTLVLGGDRVWWAAITAEEWLCCAAPLPLVSPSVSLPERTIDLTLRSCVELDCECVPKAPTTFETWMPLGILPPGSWTLTLGAIVETFDVPAP
jgi:hypothetical protein